MQTIRQIIKQIDEHDLMALAAEIAFGLLLALFPVMLIFVTMLGLVQSPQNVQYIASLLGAFLPAEIYSALDPAIRSLASTAGERSILTISLFTGFWSIATVFLTVIKAQERICAIKPSPFYNRMLRSIALTLAVSLALFLIINAVYYYLLAQFQIVSRFSLWMLSPYILKARFLLAFAVLFVAMLLIYRYSAPREAEPSFMRGFRHHFAGAALMSISWILLTLVFQYIVKIQTPSGELRSAYSYVGRMISMMVWLYINSFMFLLGAASNRVLRSKRR